MTVEDRGQVLALGAEAVAQGARQHTACERVGVTERTLHRWQRPHTAEDGPGGRARLHAIHCHRGSGSRSWRWRRVLSFAIGVRIRSSHAWRTEEPTVRQSRPSPAC